jgi:hypothetical protein
MKCYIWSIALYGVETWTLRKLDQKNSVVFSPLAEVPGKFGNVVLEKDGEDKLDGPHK